MTGNRWKRRRQCLWFVVGAGATQQRTRYEIFTRCDVPVLLGNYYVGSRSHLLSRPTSLVSKYYGNYTMGLEVGVQMSHHVTFS